MAHKKNNTDLTELLLQCITQPDLTGYFRCSC